MQAQCAQLSWAQYRLLDKLEAEDPQGQGSVWSPSCPAVSPKSMGLPGAMGQKGEPIF